MLSLRRSNIQSSTGKEGRAGLKLIWYNFFSTKSAYARASFLLAMNLTPWGEF